MNDVIKELRKRHAVCDFCIHLLMVMDDPRAPEAIEHYKTQLAEIDGKITGLEQGERKRLGMPDPEPVIVGLASATISNTVPKP